MPVECLMQVRLDSLKVRRGQPLIGVLTTRQPVAQIFTWVLVIVHRTMKMKRLCARCAAVRYRRPPTHLVHPKNGRRGERDSYGRALCPTCLAVWRFNPDNTAELVV